MGFFNKIKNAVLGKKDELENKVIDKIIPGRKSSALEVINDYQTENQNQMCEGLSAHEVELKRRQEANELRAAELEAEMQERMMAKGGFIDSLVNAQTEMMNAATTAVKQEQQKQRLADEEE
ncbi:MAG: hypothetical protein LBR37_00105 [Erysipelotrichaceae bacterium]|jgi:hypothetical protein|nr:hypothetical protein [Erysipelotrichaceae bacterium]